MKIRTDKRAITRGRRRRREHGPAGPAGTTRVLAALPPPEEDPERSAADGVGAIRSSTARRAEAAFRSGTRAESGTAGAVRSARKRSGATNKKRTRPAARRDKAPDLVRPRSQRNVAASRDEASTTSSDLYTRTHCASSGALKTHERSVRTAVYEAVTTPSNRFDGRRRG